MKSAFYLNDVIDIVNYMALQLSLIYFVARTKTVGRILFEKKSVCQIFVVGILGGGIAVLSNIYFSHFLEWYIVGVAPQTSLLFGMLFGAPAGFLVGIFSIVFAFIAGNTPSYYSIVTVLLGLAGGAFHHYHGKPWDKLSAASVYMFAVYALTALSFSCAGRFGLEHWIAVIGTLIFKTTVNVWVFYVIAHIFKERRTLATTAALTTELEIARQLQQRIIPNFGKIQLPQQLDISAALCPAKIVGGDWCDYHQNHDRVCLIVGDVSDKGIPAALFMSASCAAFRANLDSVFNSPADIMLATNNSLHETNSCFMFVTACCAELNLNNGKLRWCSVGHPPFALLREKKVSFHSATDKGVLGLNRRSHPYTVSEIQLQPDDLLFFFTDGVTEATNADRKLFGQAGIHHCLSEKNYTKAADALNELLAEITSFVGKVPQSDDICVVALRYICEEGSEKCLLTMH